MARNLSLQVAIANAQKAVIDKAEALYNLHCVQPSILSLDILGEAAKAVPTDSLEIQSLWSEYFEEFTEARLKHPNLGETDQIVGVLSIQCYIAEQVKDFYLANY